MFLSRLTGRFGRKRALVAAAALLTPVVVPIATSTPAGAGAALDPIYFEKISVFETPGGVAEIIAGNTNGDKVFYTDSNAEEIGAVDLTDPENPTLMYTVPVDGEPTSVAVVPSGLFAVAAVDNPDTGSELIAFRASDGQILNQIPLNGQPDSVAISAQADGEGNIWLAVAMENEESPTIPGQLAVININDVNGIGGPVSQANWPPSWGNPVYVDFAGADPEPEFVDILDKFAVVSLQESNEIATVNLRAAWIGFVAGTIVNQKTAGTVTQRADLTEDDLVSFTEQIVDSPVLPDAIGFSPDGFIVAAGEGEDDLTGARNLTVYDFGINPKGTSDESLELRAVQAGHYDDGRSANKGVEIEGIEFGYFTDLVSGDPQTLVFAGSERGDFVQVFRLRKSGVLDFYQLLPTGQEPEGLLAMSQRGLFLTSNEEDGTITIFRQSAAPAYPDILSEADPASAEGDPIWWSALSGLSAGDDPSEYYAVGDNAIGESKIWRLDGSGDPDRLVEEIAVTDDGVPASLDLEGIAAKTDVNGDPNPSEGFWLVSEGGTDTENLLVETDGAGNILTTIELPASVDANQLRWGFEGVTVTGDDRYVYVAFQREWAGEGQVRIGQYDVLEDVWGFFGYDLEVPSTVEDSLDYGLSEIVALSDTEFAVIERNGESLSAADKKIFGFSIDGVSPTFCNGTCPLDPASTVTGKTLLRDLVAQDGYTFEKVEGLALRSDGVLVVANDNDGVGETRLLDLPASILDFNPAAFELDILHINDHHSHLNSDRLSIFPGGERVEVELGGFPRVVTAIDDAIDSLPASANVAKIHAGDAITGTLFYTLFAGEADAALMNEVCFDIFALGNHEFDGGDAGLVTFLDFLNAGGCGTETLAANVVPQIGTPLAPVNQDDYIKPFVIEDYDGTQVGYIGIDIAQKTEVSSNPDPTTQFLDEVTTAQLYIDQLTEAEVDHIVLVTHQGYGNDQAMAAALSGVDVIVGGDSHSLLGDFPVTGLSSQGAYPTVTTDLDGNTVCIVQAWQYSHAFGQLKVTFDDNGDVTACAGDPTVIIGEVTNFDRDGNDVSPTQEDVDAFVASEANVVKYELDADAQAVLDVFNEQVEILEQEVVGTATEDICLARFPDDGRSSLCAVGTLPNGGEIQQLVTEAFLARAFRADIALQNSGGVRIDIPAGDVTIADAYELLPFANTLFELEMTGAEIELALEQGLGNVLDAGGSTGAFPYGAGIRWDLDASQAFGSRFSNIEVRRKGEATFSPIVATDTYIVVANSFMASGGDGYAVLADVVADGRGVDTFLDYAQSFIDYIEEDAAGSISKPTEFSLQSYIPAP